jgi:hypothetical protein
MKYLISLILLASPFAFAGGSGGTLRFVDGTENTQIVYNMGEDSGLVKFSTAHLVDGQWQVQTQVLPASEIAHDEAMSSALQTSQSLNQWAQIK